MMLSLAEALERVMSGAAPLGLERIDLARASGRVLGEDVAVVRPNPPFDASAMDGYAVEAAVTEGRRELRVSQEIPAGAVPRALEPGTAARVFTGAPIPPGADAVVIQEDVVRNGDSIRLASPVRAGEHVRKRGEDLREDEVALGKGATLDAGAIAVAASQGRTRLVVFRRARVSIVTTGDELREVDEPLGPGAIVNSNAHALSVLVEAAGASPVVHPIVRDEAGALRRALDDALTSSDVVLSCGGVSVGDFDLVRDAIAELGVEVLVEKVSLKPGKPVTYGRRGAVSFFGLPGNPASAMVTFELFVRPHLAAREGSARPFPHLFEAALEHAWHRESPRRTELARARLGSRGGRLTVGLLAKQSSGALSSMAAADALVLLPSGREHYAAGDPVRLVHRSALTGSDANPYAGY
jgi:molybdopterin molybdotransferase